MSTSHRFTMLPATGGVPNRAQRRLNMMVLVALGVVIFIVLLLANRNDEDEKIHSPFPGPYSEKIVAATAAVASENGICSVIGVATLKKGGSSVDAAIATSLCIGVTNSFSSGIGGGGFMLVRNVTGGYEFVDFRETAPAAAFMDMYKDDPTKASVGGLSIAVPGELRGFEYAHNKWGKLPWKDLFAGAIEVAEDGWEVNAVFANRMQLGRDFILADKEGFAKDFTGPDGDVLKEGDVCKRARLANTLRTLAEQGATAFYEGPIADSLVKTVKRTNGIMTAEDLKSYEIQTHAPLVGFYHGRKVIAPNAPSSGAMLLSILNIVEGFDFKYRGNTSDTIHLLIEAFKFGAAQRGLLGDSADPIFKNITAIERIMIGKDLAAKIRQNISPDTTYEPKHYLPNFEAKEDHGTMHVSVLNTQDNTAVSLTSTVNLVFGSQVMDPVTGIILNDEMDDFSIPGVPNYFGLSPSPYNFIHPGKRPLSSMVPTIVERDGIPEIVIGASGGSMIPTAVVATILHMVDFGLDINDAIDMPRFHHQLVPNSLKVENAFSPYYSEALEAKGHVIDRLPPGQKFVGVSGIRRLENGLLTAASDARKGGIAAGY
ncbi:hypothetical protein HDU98_001411 [Podochytrium sp. JEL0797]|nr:hypothetical protein HDU98_001411 [Podochytrium sp. JEL0797]